MPHCLSIWLGTSSLRVWGRQVFRTRPSHYSSESVAYRSPRQGLNNLWILYIFQMHYPVQNQKSGVEKQKAKKKTEL